MYSWDNAQVVLVGNKSDLEQDRAVTLDRGKRLADQLGKCLMLYFGCTLFVGFFLFAFYLNVVLCFMCFLFKGFYR